MVGEGELQEGIMEGNMASFYGTLGVGLFIGLVVGLGSVGLVDLFLNARKAKELNREEENAGSKHEVKRGDPVGA